MSKERFLELKELIRVPETLANTKTPLDNFKGEYVYYLTEDVGIVEALVFGIRDRDTTEPKIMGISMNPRYIQDKAQPLDCVYVSFDDAKYAECIKEAGMLMASLGEQDDEIQKMVAHAMWLDYKIKECLKR